MGESWNMSSDQYSWLVTIYYIAYISFHWTILMWKVVTLPTWVMYVYPHSPSCSHKLTDL